MADRSRRVDFLGPRTRHRGLLHAGWLRAASASSYPLGPHRHEGGYELCLIVSGEAAWWAEDTEYLLGPGDAYLTRPGEWHGGAHGVVGPAELFWAIFALPGPRGAYGLSEAQARALAERFAASRLRSFVGGEPLRASFARLHNALRSKDGLAAARVRSAVLGLLIDAADAIGDAATARRGPTSPIRRAMAWVRDHLDEPASVEDLAEMAGLSVSRFHERFVAETGFSPGDWRARQRVARAKRLLRMTDRSIVDIAMSCGYASSQYFATAFGRLVGVSPSAYRSAEASATSGATSRRK
ncbi:MAG: AraC family transcriptional regulator [Planctomycetota bacterium]